MERATGSHVRKRNYSRQNKMMENKMFSGTSYHGNFLHDDPLAVLDRFRVSADIERAVVAVRALRAPVQLAVRARLRVDLLYHLAA